MDEMEDDEIRKLGTWIKCRILEMACDLDKLEEKKVDRATIIRKLRLLEERVQLLQAQIEKH
jgi:hypothetical protein